jgi:nickel-dependent lactate racemase
MRNPVERIDRRAFLGQAGSALLIGNAFVRGVGLDAGIAAPDSRSQSVTIRTHEFYGDIIERIDLPREWRVTTVPMPGSDLPALTPDRMRQAIDGPIGTPPLAEIAAGKRTAMILFDDITRPTPADEVVPFVLEELRKAGIEDRNILFLCCLGSHRGATNDEMRRKLGDAVVDHYTWVNHNCYENCTDLGTTASGNRIMPNHYLMQAEVKVGISGLKLHGAPGYSGGAKIVLPGCSHLDSIQYMHRIPGRAGAIHHNECRADMEEAARRVGLDFTVQITINGARRTSGVFAGNFADAWRAGVRVAVERYRTELADPADVVIANPYPRNMQDAVTFRWQASLREGGTYVEICQIPLGRYSTHYLKEREAFPHGWSGENLAEERPSNRDPIPHASQVLVYSQYLQHRDLWRYRPDRLILCKTWDEIRERLEKRHGPSTQAVVYPHTGIQHPPLTLDEP